MAATSSMTTTSTSSTHEVAAESYQTKQLQQCFRQALDAAGGAACEFVQASEHSCMQVTGRLCTAALCGTGRRLGCAARVC
jgi:hypothetical protein